MTSRRMLRVGGGPARRVSSVMSCRGIYVVASVSHRSWSASSITQRLGMPPPHESHHLPALVISVLLWATEEPSSGWPARQAVLLPGQRCSQLVPLRDPILPILDRLAGLLVHRDALQLGQGNRKASAFPADQDEHLMVALLVGGHPDDLDLLADAQRRDAALGDAPGHKREVQPVLEGVVPARGLLFGRVGIHDDLHGDALLPLLVARWSLHQACLSAPESASRKPSLATPTSETTKRPRCGLQRRSPHLGNGR